MTLPVCLSSLRLCVSVRVCAGVQGRSFSAHRVNCETVSTCAMVAGRRSAPTYQESIAQDVAQGVAQCSCLALWEEGRTTSSFAEWMETELQRLHTCQNHAARLCHLKAVLQIRRQCTIGLHRTGATGLTAQTCTLSCERTSRFSPKSASKSSPCKALDRNARWYLTIS